MASAHGVNGIRQRRVSVRLTQPPSGQRMNQKQDTAVLSSSMPPWAMWYPQQSESTWRERANLLGTLAFFAVLATTLFDMNALMKIITGRSQVASPVLLLACLVSFVAFQFRLPKALGASGIAFIVSYVFFIGLGCASRLLGEFDQTEIWVLTYWLRMHITSVVIVLATALGARYYAARYSPGKTLVIVFGVAMLQVLAVLLSRQFGTAEFVQSDVHEKFNAAGRATGLLSNPNATGNLMAAIVAIGLACLVWGKWRIPVILGLAGTGIACVMTFSRSSMIAMFIVAASQVFYSPIVRKKSALIGSVLVIGGLVWFITAGAEKLELNEKQEKRITSFSDIWAGEYDESDLGNRFVQAAIGLREWARSPVFGLGLGRGSRMDTVYGWTLGTHNHYILILVETGIMGLIPYVVFFLVTAWVAWWTKCDVTRTFALGYLVAYICHNLTGHNVPTQNYHAVFLGVMFGLLAARRPNKFASGKKRSNVGGLGRLHRRCRPWPARTSFYARRRSPHGRRSPSSLGLLVFLVIRVLLLVQEPPRRFDNAAIRAVSR